LRVGALQLLTSPLQASSTPAVTDRACASRPMNERSLMRRLPVTSALPPLSAVATRANLRGEAPLRHIRSRHDSSCWRFSGTADAPPMLAERHPIETRPRDADRVASRSWSCDLEILDRGPVQSCRALIGQGPIGPSENRLLSQRWILPAVFMLARSRPPALDRNPTAAGRRDLTHPAPYPFTSRWPDKSGNSNSKPHHDCPPFRGKSSLQHLHHRFDSGRRLQDLFVWPARGTYFTLTSMTSSTFSWSPAWSRTVTVR